MNKIYFTSDTHFNHANIIQYSDRPFKGIDHMTEVLIANWNKKVKPGDVVYHLGDFSLSWGPKHESMIDDILLRLNGQKYLILGNHDRDEVINNKRWIWARHYHEIKVNVGGDSHQIMMFHYALRSWNKMGRGPWMLYGHSHGNLPWHPGKSMDVGVDPNDYGPLSVQYIKTIMDKRPI